jgi:hypothetical protein
VVFLGSDLALLFRLSGMCDCDRGGRRTYFRRWIGKGLGRNNLFWRLFGKTGYELFISIRVQKIPVEIRTGCFRNKNCEQSALKGNGI